MEDVEIVVTKTRYNVATMLGWLAFVLGLVTAALQYFQITTFGYIGAAVGLIGAGIAITNTGPLRTVTRHKVRGRSIAKNN